MNPSVFASSPSNVQPVTSSKGTSRTANVKNAAGGVAYQMGDKLALATTVLTGCFSNTYYATAEENLTQIKDLCGKVPAEFVAKLAVYARAKGYMKDTPAFLLAHLASLKTEEANKLLAQVFPVVIDSTKMLKNFCQVVRSGVTGRKSFGSAVKRLIATWLNKASASSLFNDTGDQPSLGDIIKMVHPTCEDKEKVALYGYLIGRKVDEATLPALVREYEGFKKDRTGKDLPKVAFQKLTALELTPEDWKSIARNASWTQTRMNLNTFQRHGVFSDPSLVKLVADRLRNPELVRNAKVFPYQLLTAFQNISGDIPTQVANALQDAMEIATQNVPTFGVKVVVCPDVSGSMGSPVTGTRASKDGKSTMTATKTKCVDVSALISSVVLRTNEDAEVLPFDNNVHSVKLNARDSVMTNAKKLAICGGGTTVSAPLAHLNARGKSPDLVIIVSDNESWGESGITFTGWGYSHKDASGTTATMREFDKLKARNPKAKLVCIDINAHGTTQAQERRDVLNVSGWSDNIFEVIRGFVNGENDRLVSTVEAEQL